MIPVSVCIIAKNEEKHMENFLRPLRAFDWEIIVVDTGSTDRTREIALQYADKVVDFEWINDFSAARNFSISQASYDHILVMDCDEYICEINMEEILRLLKEYPQSVGCITRRNHFPSNGKDTVSIDYTERLFHKAYFHYEQPIHEQLVLIDNSNPEYTTYNLPLTAEHYGYVLSEEEMQAKIKRNNDLLFSMLEKDPENAYVLFQIGQAYFMADDYEAAYPYLRKSLLLEAQPTYEYVHNLVISYGYCLLHTERLEEAMNLLQLYDYYCISSDFCCLAGDIYLRNNYPLKAMAQYVKAMSCDISFVEDSKFNIPVYNIGYINEMLGDIPSALMQYKRCKDFPLAEERIKYLES